MSTPTLTASGQLAERLRRSLPGGDTRTGTWYRPHPVAIARGEGCRVWDVDGNEYLDLLCNFTSLVHGYGAPGIVQALQAQLADGTAFAAPHALQAEVAERIKARLTSVEHVRYANSGTEAMMLAVRAARAFTGRVGIVKARGGYHGFWEQLQMAPGGAGVPAAVDELVSDHHYNDVDDLRAVVASRDDLAAIVLEPVMTAAGVIEADPEYLAEARRLASERGALLILDEIVTLRLDPHGWQGHVGVTPDLTTLGKIIGGGMPVGAVAGRADVLAVFDPARPGHVVHSGTFNGNAMTLAAGRASLDALTAEEIARLNGLGARLAATLRERLPGAVVTQTGSIMQVHAETGPVIRRYADTNMGSPVLARFHRAALEHGVFMAARGLLCLSTPMDEALVDEAAERLAAAWQAAGGGEG